MQILIYCAVGLVICALWLVLQFWLYNWADNNPTRWRKSVSTASLLLLSAALTLIGFTVVGTIVAWLVALIFS